MSTIVNVKEQKNILRSKHKKIRLNCSEEIKTQLDNVLTQKFLELDEYKKSEIVFAFVSTKIEVNTLEILQRVIDDKKILALPKCRQNEPIMDFYEVTNLNLLDKGAYSIYEPNSEKCKKVTDFSSGICLVPGLAFDLSGYRIGFGKGYYDRFLINFFGTTVALCYSKCIEPKIPVGIFDKSVDILITEKFTNDTRNVFRKGWCK